MSKYEEYQEALNELKAVIHDEFDGTKLLNSHLEKIKTLQELVDKHSKLEKIFGDRHICEIKARFNEIECNADKCNDCPLAIGDDMCLKIIFEDKWQFQEERDNLKQQIIDQTKSLTLEEVKKEWKALGYEWMEDFNFIILRPSHSGCWLSIDKVNKNYMISGSHISVEVNKLFTKTFRALGWFDE